MIFCRVGTTVVEFTRANKANFSLYAGLAKLFGMNYWTVVDESTSKDRLEKEGMRGIRPSEVVTVVSVALQKPPAGRSAQFLQAASRAAVEIPSVPHRRWFEDAK